jgi:hypothetical protein
MSANVISSTMNSLGEASHFAIVGSAGDSLWYFNPQINPLGPVDSHWAELSPAAFTQISATRDRFGDPVVFATVASAGDTLWLWTPAINPGGPTDSHWALISPAPFAQISATQNSEGDPVVFGTVASAGFSLWAFNWQFNPAGPITTHWNLISGAPFHQISATQDSSGNAAVFGTVASAGFSLWEYTWQFNPLGPISTHWNLISPAVVDQISATRDRFGDPVVFATVASAGHTLWEYDWQFNPLGPISTHWDLISPAAINQISATQNSEGDPVVFATVASAGFSTWEYNWQFNPGAPITSHWNLISSAAADQLAATQNEVGEAVVFATISSAGHSDWEYNPLFYPDAPVASHWNLISPAFVG